MNQDFQIRHGSKHYRPCNQYKHRFHRSHHRSLLGGRSVKPNLRASFERIRKYLGQPFAKTRFFFIFCQVFDDFFKFHIEKWQKNAVILAHKLTYLLWGHELSNKHLQIRKKRGELGLVYCIVFTNSRALC